MLQEQNKHNVSHLHDPLDAECFSNVSEWCSTPSRCTSRPDWRQRRHLLGVSDSAVPGGARLDTCHCPSTSLGLLSHSVPLKKTKLSHLVKKITKLQRGNGVSCFCCQWLFSSKQQSALNHSCHLTGHRLSKPWPLDAQNWCFAVVPPAAWPELSTNLKPLTMPGVGGRFIDSWPECLSYRTSTSS